MPSRNPNEILARNLKKLRIAHGWSQEEFGAECNLHRTYIGAIERGERNVTLNTLLDIASVLGVSAAELISESEPRGKASAGSARQDRKGQKQTR